MKKNTIIITITILVLIMLSIGGYFILTKKDDAKTTTTNDSKKFASEYTEVSEDNVFVYRDIDEIIKIMKNGTGVVYLGFPECKWCQAYVKYLDEIAKEVGIEKIYYCNISEDRKNNTEKYQEVLSMLEGNLQFDDEGNARIYVPNVSFHIKGELIGNDYETSKDTHNLKEPKDYWTKDEVKDLKQRLTKYMKKVYSASNICTDCNK